MTQTALATREDFYAYGLGREAFAPVVRPIVAVNATANTLRLGAPAPPADTPLRLESTGTLPAPLAQETIYYALAVADADDTIQLAATGGGAPINLSDAGSADTNHSVVVQIGSLIDRQLEATSALWVEDMVAHRGPISYDDCPLHVTKGICEEVAGNITTTRGLLRPGYADPSVPGRAATAREQRARYRKGQPVYGLTDATPDTADNAAVVIESAVEANDWANEAAGGYL